MLGLKPCFGLDRFYDERAQKDDKRTCQHVDDSGKRCKEVVSNDVIVVYY